MGCQRHAPAALPPGKTRYPLYRRLGEPQGRSGRVRKIPSPTGIRSPDRSARSESLYRLSYRGSRLWGFVQHHVQRVLRSLSLRIKQPRPEANHVHLVSRLGIGVVISPLPFPYVFVACTGLPNLVKYGWTLSMKSSGADSRVK